MVCAQCLGQTDSDPPTERSISDGDTTITDTRLVSRRDALKVKGVQQRPAAFLPVP